MKKIIFALTMFLAVTAAAQTGCVTGGGVSCTGNLNLWLLPPHYQNWGTPWNANAAALDTLAGSVVLYAPHASQTVTQTTGTYFNVSNPFVFGYPSLIRFGVTAGTADGYLTRIGAGSFSLDSSAAGNGLGSLNFGGFTFGGAGGTSGQVPCSDGTSVNHFCSISSGLYYQTAQAAGTAAPQESALNFLAGFTVTDDPTNHRTNVAVTNAVPRVQLSLPATTVNANTCSTTATTALSGVTATSTFSTAFASNPTAAVGWGANGGLVVELWPDASPNVLDWSICNQSSSNITPTAIMLNVGVN